MNMSIELLFKQAGGYVEIDDGGNKSTYTYDFDPETFGRLSESFARFLGTARFLVYMTVFVATWVIWNTVAPTNLRWDDYPFIFLTLILSTSIVCCATNFVSTESSSRS